MSVLVQLSTAAEQMCVLSEVDPAILAVGLHSNFDGTRVIFD